MLKNVDRYQYYVTGGNSEQHRTLNHAYWCWAVTLVRSYIGALNSNLGITNTGNIHLVHKGAYQAVNSGIMFIKKFHDRIVKVLSYEGEEP